MAPDPAAERRDRSHEAPLSELDGLMLILRFSISADDHRSLGSRFSVGTPPPIWDPPRRVRGGCQLCRHPDGQAPSLTGRDSAIERLQHQRLGRAPSAHVGY